jgi:hypothetical protein
MEMIQEPPRLRWRPAASGELPRGLARQGKRLA